MKTAGITGCVKIGHIFRLRYLFPMLLLLLPAVPSSLNAAPGETALSFLRLEMDARPLAMGAAATASASSHASAWWNPALASEQAAPGFTAGYLFWIEGIHSGSVASTFKIAGLDFGAGLLSLSSGTMERRYNDPTTQSAGVFDAADLALYFCHARSAGPFSAGLSAEFFYERIDDQYAAGCALSAGLYTDRLPGGHAAALALRHLGPDFGFAGEKRPLPAALRLGLSAAPVKLGELLYLTAAADVEIMRLEGAFFGTGAEIALSDLVSFRGGWKFWSEGNLSGEDDGLPGAPAAGLGVKAGFFTVDYVYEPVRNSLGTAHRFEISVSP